MPLDRQLLRHLRSRDAMDPTAPILRAWASDFLVSGGSAAELGSRVTAFHTEVCRRLTVRAGHACLERIHAEVLPRPHARDPRDCPERLAFPDAHVADGRPPPLEGVDGEPSWSLLGLVRREIVAGLGQGTGWDAYDHPGSLSLATAMALVEKLSIDSPVRSDVSDPRRDFDRALGMVAWMRGEFWPRWVSWCLDPGWCRHEDPRVVDEYERVYAVLEKLKEKGAPQKSLSKMLVTKADRVLVEFREYPVVVGQGGVAFWKIELPPKWRTRPWQTPAEFATGAMAHAHKTNTREIKERLAHSRREQALAYTWLEYRRWLAANPEALRELEHRLGRSLVAS